MACIGRAATRRRTFLESYGSAYKTFVHHMADIKEKIGILETVGWLYGYLAQWETVALTLPIHLLPVPFLSLQALRTFCCLQCK